MYVSVVAQCLVSFFCQAEDGIRDLVRSRGLGDVYKRQFLLEVLSDFQVTVPELGTIRAVQPPIVVITSNRTLSLIHI